MVISATFAASLSLAVAAPPPQPDPGRRCDDLLPNPAQQSLKRPLKPEDLLQLRDIGFGDWPFSGEGALAISPDGQAIAFQVRRADAVRNSYCLALVVLPLRQGARPDVIDSGGELIRQSFTFRGKAGFPTGMPLVIAPQWSPDGRWIAYLKRTEETTQVWRANADGFGAKPITQSAIDVEAFRVATNGKSILFATRPGMEAARLAIEQEGLGGYHVDDRYSPMSSSRPFPPAPIDRQIWFQDMDGGAPRVATEEEGARLLAGDAPTPSAAVTTTTGVRLAWLEADTEAPATIRLHADDPTGVPVPCSFETCTELRGVPWWTRDTRRVRFFRREGWAGEATAIYEWSPGPRPPELLFRTTDLITDCAVQDERLICLAESSVQPRRLMSIDLTTRRSSVVFDPNPEFRSLLLGKTERLRWKNDAGLEVFGNLVLPVTYRARQHYPLVVVQYESRGFLRGGTGDEFPVQVFANRGYAVLSVNRPTDIGRVQGGQDSIAVERLNLANFADRKSALSAVEIGVDLLTKRGIVDPANVGITGLSDGTSTVQFALASGRSYRAASATGCCWEDGYQAFVGSAAASQFEAMGFPKLTDNRTTFWKAYSLLPNARAITTPLLIQSADDEYVNGLAAVTALRELGKPVDLYAFPDEHHVKWQPAHRLAVYMRNLAWFDFWLKGIRDESYKRQAELDHWSAMASEAKAGQSNGSPGHAAQ